MAAAAAAAATISGPSISSLSSSSPKLLYFSHSSLSVKPNSPFSTPPLYLNFPLPHKKLKFVFYSTVQELAVEETQTQEESTEEEEEKKKKLYVVNLPWTVSVADIKSLFGECGTVKDVEIIKQRDGRNRGYAFITMDSGDECRAVIEKFDSYELSGRVIRVEFAKRFKKPLPPRAAGTLRAETRHRLYVSNLAWKARSTHLRELFSADFNPVSARVVFDSPNGRSAGYGFVSFATKEEAEAALAAMDGKELMDRPIRLKFSEKGVDKSQTEVQEESTPQDNPVEADNIIGKPEES